jgi:5'-methylthioadenosine phosphorylase
MKADIGVFGGSGFYSFLENIEEVEIDTPYGKPSDKISIASYKGKKIAFLPRHGKAHAIPPHLINFRANLHAMNELEVKKNNSSDCFRQFTGTYKTR